MKECALFLMKTRLNAISAEETQQRKNTENSTGSKKVDIMNKNDYNKISAGYIKQLLIDITAPERKGKEGNYKWEKPKWAATAPILMKNLFV